MRKLLGVKYCKVQPCKITRLRPIQQHICNSECNGFLLCASVKVIYQLATHFLQIIKQWIKEHSLIIPTTEADSSLTRSLIFEKLLGSLATGFALYECTGKIHFFFQSQEDQQSARAARTCQKNYVAEKNVHTKFQLQQILLRNYIQ